MSLSRTRSIGVAFALAYAVAVLVAACSSPEYFTEGTTAARGGKKSGSSGSAAGTSGDLGGSDSAGGDGTGLGEGGDTSGGIGGDTAVGVAGTTAVSTLGGRTNSAGMSNGGASTAKGGSSVGVAGSGAATSVGGASNGGTVGTGGAVAAGGTSTGGAVAAGGMGIGGAVGAGRSSTGGAIAAGGVGIGGAVGAGRSSTGGAIATGGASTGGAVATGGAGTGGAPLDPDLVLWYKFDDASGTTAADSSGNGRTGTLTPLSTGTAAYSTTRQVGTGSLELTSSTASVGAYVVVPTNLQAMGATTAVTISCWVRLTSIQSWQRVFDFGSGSSTTSSYMFLTVQQNQTTPNSPRFAISTTGNVNEQVINMTTPAALSTGVWHHLAVVLGAGTTYTGTLYIDNVVAGTNAAMTLRPSDLGATTRNWLGRSQFTAYDPLLNALLDDFRIYKRALTAAEIATLYAVR